MSGPPWNGGGCGGHNDEQAPELERWALEILAQIFPERYGVERKQKGDREISDVPGSTTPRKGTTRG